MPVDRDAIRDAAKYLRRVRPIDPAEISEYVPGRPDPRAVRRVLYEEAPSLGLLEREDGTFSPPEEGPVTPAFQGVEGLPDHLVDVVESLLVGEFGPDWDRGESAQILRERIRRLKRAYYRQRSVTYDEAAVLAYAIYHLPAYFASSQYVFWDLARDGLLDRTLRVLDVGAGVGGPALGLDALLADEGVLVDYHAVEPSSAAAVLESMLAETHRNFHWAVHRETAESFEPVGDYDVVLFSNVLNELASPAETAERYLDATAESGTLVAIAPADRNTSLGLREIELRLESRGATVYAPMVRLWPGERPDCSIWSFDERPAIDTPRFQAALAEGADRPDEFHHETIKFSYSFLRRDGTRRFAVDANEHPVSKLRKSRAHVTDRLDVLVAKLSRDIADEGHPLFTVSDGSEAERHFAVLVNETPLNRTLLEAGYGDLLTIERALVLWNDEEEAINLVVDDETIVDPA